MYQSRLIIPNKDARSENIRPFIRRVFRVKLTVGNNADYGSGIPVDEIPPANANARRQLIQPLPAQSRPLRDHRQWEFAIPLPQPLPP
ncbi:hypothetical protein J2792_004306 [Novosphingobium capsulatum]|uniref:Uncharacterized protein n=1 Tax=Novosphingobium capsulatum TaxID=13688 RepID=A0ABU1MUA1_9SPHN|nr:hypothetical protein [Novosphingobium capsulatum]